MCLFLLIYHQHILIKNPTIEKINEKFGENKKKERFALCSWLLAFLRGEGAGIFDLITFLPLLSTCYFLYFLSTTSNFVWPLQTLIDLNF